MLAHQEIEDIELLVSELVTNGVRHGSRQDGARIRLRVHPRGGRLRFEVTDQGSRADGEPDPSRDGSGYGLALVDSLAVRWGVEREGATTVWFEVEPSQKPSRV